MKKKGMPDSLILDTMMFELWLKKNQNKFNRQD